jgi:hypothetical protein
MGLFDAIKKVAAAVVKNPVVKVAGSGLALAFPKAVPAAAAVRVAGTIVSAAKGQSGTPAQQASARRVVNNTFAAAKKGDPNATRAVAAMKVATKAQALTSSMPGYGPGWHVDKAGKIRVLAA